MRISIIAVALLIFCGSLIADEYKGKVKSVDTDKNKVTLTVDDKDKTFNVDKDPLITNDKGKTVPGGLSAVKVGTEVVIFTDKKDGNESVTTFKVGALKKKKN